MKKSNLENIPSQKVIDCNKALRRKAKEIIRTKQGKIDYERSKKVDDLFRQGNTTDMLKTMFGQS